MVRSRPVFIFIALGAASIAGAAPLRLAASAEPASQEAASLCARFDQDKAGSESGNPQDCRRSELDVSSSEDYVLDMGSFSSSRDASVIVPLPPFDSPSSQEHADADTASAPGIESRALHPSGPFVSPSSQERADADDTASVPGIASRALHPSGQLESFRRSFGVLSSRTSHAPLAHSLLRKRTDTGIASADDPDPPATLRISVPLQPTSTFSTSFPSVAASVKQHQDPREEEDTILAALSIGSHGPNSSGSLHPSAVSISHTLVQEHTNTNIGVAHSIESRSPPVSSPLVASSHPPDPDVHYFVSHLQPADIGRQVHEFIMKKMQASYAQDTQGPTNWYQFVNTNSGQLWLKIDRLLAESHTGFERFSVKVEFISDIILAHLDSATIGDSLHVYEVVKNWNIRQYRDDVRTSKDQHDFSKTETGVLFNTLLLKLAQSHTGFGRLSVKAEFMSDIILAHRDPATISDPLHLYEVVKNWNTHQYWDDARTSENLREFSKTETGALLSTLLKRLGLDFERFSLKVEFISDIILAHLDSATIGDPLHVYKVVKNWNVHQYRDDVGISKDQHDFSKTETGVLLSTLLLKLAQSHTGFGRLLVNAEFWSDIIVAHLDSATIGDPLHVYEAVKNWNVHQYRDDVRISKDQHDLSKTETGVLLSTLLLKLAQSHTGLGRTSVNAEFMSDIILAHRDPATIGDPLHLYEVVKNWNVHQYWDDARTSKNLREFSKTETGALLFTLRKRLGLAHTDLERFSVKVEFISDIILAHLNSATIGEPLHVYEAVKNWNVHQYRDDVRTSKDQRDFSKTETGVLLSTLLLKLAQSHTGFERLSVNAEFMSDIILAHRDPATLGDPLHVYKVVKNWNVHQYWDDARTSKNQRDFNKTETGALLSALLKRLGLTHQQSSVLFGVVGEDLDCIDPDREAFRRMKGMITRDDTASLRAANGDLSTFLDQKHNSPCAQRFRTEVENSPPNVAAALNNRLTQLLKANQSF
ncbi:hypothetical protein C8R42DRAFT_708147 [Lentinula raphanica]|nr:hypothetical protein C8R42DRAFT_708147 [Lentinula raphanica]